MTKRPIVAVIGLYSLLYILPLGIRPMFIPDETRYAEIPREMRASDDWIVPHVNGLRYFEKPVLGYWVTAACMSLFGQNRFATRLPSALATGLSSLMILCFLIRCGHRPLAGILSAAGFLTCAEVFGAGVYNLPDSLFSMFVTAAMVCFFSAYREDRPTMRTALFALCGASSGLAFLTKGFLAIGLPIVTIVPFMFWARRGKDLLRITWLPLGVGVLVVLPWCVWIYLREPDYWHYFFWVEHLQRFFSLGGGSQHTQPMWFFIPIVLAGALPWTVLVPAALEGLRRSGLFSSPPVRFAMCWFCFPFIFFSISKGKLGTYILPCFAPLVILLTIGLLAYFEGGRNKAFSVGAHITTILAGLVLATLAFTQTTRLTGITLWSDTEIWKWMTTAIGLLGLISFSFSAARVQDLWPRLALYCAGPVLLLFCFHFTIPDCLNDRLAPETFLLRNAHRIQSDSEIVVAGSQLVPAVCWCYKRADVYVMDKSGECAYGLGYEDSKHRFLTISLFVQRAKDESRRHPLILITSAKNFATYEPLLPKPQFKDTKGKFVFAEF